MNIQFNYSFYLAMFAVCSSDFSHDSGVLTQPAIRNSSYWCHWTHKNKNNFLNQTLALKIKLNFNVTKRFLNFKCIYSPWSITVTNQDKRLILASLCRPTVKDFIIRSPFPITQVTVSSLIKMFVILLNSICLRLFQKVK